MRHELRRARNGGRRPRLRGGRGDRPGTSRVGPGLVVSCGTAITVERISEQGIWQGGAIAPGLGVSRRRLAQSDRQLPLVELHQAPPHWGASTRPALEAGVFWGTVGAVRELLDRQTADLGSDPWVIWTGGDAALLAGAVAGSEARIEPDLVLLGLAVGFARRSNAAASSHDQQSKVRDKVEQHDPLSCRTSSQRN